MADGTVGPGGIALELQRIGKRRGPGGVGIVSVLVSRAVTALTGKTGMVSGALFGYDVLVAFPAGCGPGITQRMISIFGERKPAVMTVLTEGFWNEQIAYDKKQRNDHHKRDKKSFDVLRHE